MGNLTLGTPKKLLRAIGTANPPKCPDMTGFEKLNLRDRAKMFSKLWAIEGYGVPITIPLLYVLKMGLYVAFFWYYIALPCIVVPSNNVDELWWWGEAFKRLVLYTMLFEVWGLGCGAGPLTGHYWPMWTAWWHYLTPGTWKLPGIPFVQPKYPEKLLPASLIRHERSVLDVLLYVALHVCGIVALRAPVMTTAHLAPVLIILPILGFVDKSIWLAARSEHYYTMLVCFLADDWVTAAKCIQLAIWWGAGISKCGPWFPYVLGVMMSNSASWRSVSIRSLFFKKFPDDLNPSSFAIKVAHFGTVSEIMFPYLLAFPPSFWPATLPPVGVIIMLGFHCFITSHIPMGNPTEWNIFCMIAGCFLFNTHGGLDTAAVMALPLPLLVFLFVILVFMPVYGNLFPQRVSFLLAMRYYAGNWPATIWLLKKSAVEKWNKNAYAASPLTKDQLALMYEEKYCTALTYKMIAFRSMHLHGRLTQSCIDKALASCNGRFDDYVYLEGETVAGQLLGYNFGDGYLHGEQLLNLVQSKMKFDKGELLFVEFESAPLLGSAIPWQVRDACGGHVDAGEAPLAELAKLQPWGDTK